MTMIGNSLLHMIIVEQKVYEPSLILEKLHEGVKQSLRQEKEKHTKAI